MADARFAYAIYGLRLDSTRQIPGVPIAHGSAPADIVVSFEGLPLELDVSPELRPDPWYVSATREADGTPNLVVCRLEGGEFHHFHYSDQTQFVVDRSGSRIWATWSAATTLFDTFTYLLGPLLGFVLRQRGVICLHASLVAVDGQALALLGPVGSGKSTTAAALAQRGYAILSEDVAPVAQTVDGFVAHPGYFRIRLWPQSSAMLFGSEDYLPKLTPLWDKCYLDLVEAGFRFHSQSLPLRAIYLLEARTDSADAPTLQELLPRQGLVELIANTYMNKLLAPDQRAREFELLGKLVGAVALRRVTAHADPARLGQFCQMILNDFRQCLEAPAPVGA